MKVNDVIDKFENENVKLKIQLLEDGENVLVQGSKVSLVFLAELLLAIANNSSDDGLQMSPRGAGKLFFDTKSELGFYISKTS